MAVCTNKWRKKNSIEEKSVHTEWNAFGHHRHNLYLYRLSEPTTNSGEMIVQAIKSAAFREVLLFFLYFEMWCIFISVVVLSLSVSYIVDLLSLCVSLHPSLLRPLSPSLALRSTSPFVFFLLLPSSGIYIQINLKKNWTHTANKNLELNSKHIESQRIRTISYKRYYNFEIEDDSVSIVVYFVLFLYRSLSHSVLFGRAGAISTIDLKTQATKPLRSESKCKYAHTWKWWK